MNYNLNSNKPFFKDRSEILLSKEKTFPDFRAKNIPLVSNISEPALANLITEAKAVRYTRKTNINDEFNRANSLVIIFSGNVSVSNPQQEDTIDTLIEIHEPRSGFGKVALLTDELRSASAITVERTVFAYIPKVDFVNWLKKYPEVDFALCGVAKEKYAS